MSFIKDLIERAQSVLEAPQPTQTAAVKTTWFDRKDWEETRQLPAIDAMVTELDEEISWAEDLSADVHGALYRIDPRLHDASEMAPTHAANRDVIEALLKLPEMQNLRQHSVADSYGTAMSMVAMKEPIQQAVVMVAEQYAKAQEAREQAEQRLQEAMDGAQNPGAGPEALQELQEALDAAEQAQQNNPNGEQMASLFAGPLRKQARAIDEQLSQESAIAMAYGVEPGEFQHMPVQERIELAKRLRGSRLAQFAELIGQFKQVQRAESRRRVIDAASEIHGVTTGSELTRMVAGEYLNFADPSLETLMLARWAEGQLVQHDVRGKEKVGQGPIVFVCDESGSMEMELGGATREAWSKALALAMLDQARRRDRDFTYIGFASRHQQRVVEFKGGKGPLVDVLAMTEGFLDGGTSYEVPLEMALEMCQRASDVEGKGRPDIIFVSDDEYAPLGKEFMAKWLSAKDRLAIKTYGIGVGVGVGGAMSQACDNVRSIVDLTSDPREVADLFRTI